MTHDEPGARRLVATEDMELTTNHSQLSLCPWAVGIKCQSYIPPAESSIRNLDDDILWILDFRDRALFNVDHVGTLEDDGAHGIFRGHGDYFSSTVSRMVVVLSLPNLARGSIQ